MSEPVERHLEIRKTARYWVLGADVAQPQEVWVVLHGYRQLAERFLRRFRHLADGTRRIVAPEALSRFYVGRSAGRHGSESLVGATWMTKEDRENEIRDYVRYLDQLPDLADSPQARIVILGFSQGVATATRWATLGGVRPARLVLWGDFLPPDLDLVRMKSELPDTDIVLVRGSEDPALSAELGAKEADRIAAAGLPHRIVTYEGGHDIDPATLDDLL